MAKYYANTQEDDDWPSRSYPSREDAIAKFPVDHGLVPGAPFVTGLGVKWVGQVLAESVLEQMYCDASDECGDSADGWPRVSHSKEDVDRLSNALTAIVNGWLAEHGDMPSFGRIVEVQNHIAPDPATT